MSRFGSDGNYAAATRHRRPFSKSARPPALVDDAEWAQDRLEDDALEIATFEAAVAPLLEEGELDADAIVVSPTGGSAAAASGGAAERRRRDESWNDLGLDQVVSGLPTAADLAAELTARPPVGTSTNQ